MRVPIIPGALSVPVPPLRLLARRLARRLSDADRDAVMADIVTPMLKISDNACSDHHRAYAFTLLPIVGLSTFHDEYLERIGVSPDRLLADPGHLWKI